MRVTVNLFAHSTLLVTSPTKLMLGVPVQLSIAVTAAVFCAGIALAQNTVTFDGHVILGAMLSFTVIICAQVTVLLQRSAAR